MSDPVASLTIGDFEPRTGETFRLMAKPELELKLVEALPRGETLRAGGAFSLFLRGAAGSLPGAGDPPDRPPAIRNVRHLHRADRPAQRRQRLRGGVHLSRPDHAGSRRVRS
jgi:hypothetical protein